MASLFSCSTMYVPLNTMMKYFALVVLAVLASSANAFTSTFMGVHKPIAFASRSSSSSALSMAMERTYIMVRRRRRVDECLWEPAQFSSFM
jgi:hypothetical protein